MLKLEIVASAHIHRGVCVYLYMQARAAQGRRTYWNLMGALNFLSELLVSHLGLIGSSALVERV